MARRNKHGHLLFLSKTQCLSIETIKVSPSSTRDKRARWHAETNYSHLLFFEDLNVFWSRLLKSPLPTRDNQVWWHAETIMVLIYISKMTMSSVIACLQKATMSSSTFRRWQCLQSLHAFKRRQCAYQHFEDDNVFRHCMPSKATMTIICISKKTMSSVTVCLQRRQSLHSFVSPFTKFQGFNRLRSLS